MRVLSILCLIIILACSSSASRPPPGDETPPPFCEGRDLGFTVGDALREYLTAWCAFRDPSEFPPGGCLPFVMGFWCPTPERCSTIMCGDDLLVLHPACVAYVSIAGDSLQPCLDLYDSLRQP